VTISVVQHSSTTKTLTTGTTGTAAPAFTAAAGAGNCLVVAVSMLQGGQPTLSVGSVTTNGSAENWVVGKSILENPGIGTSALAAIWVNPSTAGSQTIIDVNVASTVSFATDNCLVLVDIYEVSGLAASSVVDKTASSDSSSSAAGTWTSTATATTTQASEIYFGVVGAQHSGTLTIAATAAGWTSETKLTGTVSGNSIAQISGFQIVTATGTATYSGTLTSSSEFAACAVTLFGASGTTIPGTAGMSGDGELAAAGDIAGAASLAGDGELAAASTAQAAASLAGDGELGASATVPGAVAFAGDGELAAAGAAVVAGAAVLPGAGTLTASATGVAAVALAGDGDLASAGTLTEAAAAALAGAGTLTAAATAQAAALLAGSGTLAASGSSVIPGAASLAGAGTLTAAGVVEHAAVLAGAGTLTAAPVQESAVTLAGAGTLGSAATLTLAGAASLAGAGTLTAAGSAASALLAGAGTLAAAGTSGRVMTVTAAQSGSTTPGMVLAVKVVTGAAASPIGATASSITAVEEAITPVGTGSWVYGAAADNQSSPFSAASGTTFSESFFDSAEVWAGATFRSTSTTTAGTPVTLGSSNPPAAPGLALVEILSGSGVAESPVSPVGLSGNVTTLTTGSFLPPAGSVIVVMVGSVIGGTVAITNTGGLTFTQQASGPGSYGVVSVWTAVIPTPSVTGSAAMAGDGELAAAPSIPGAAVLSGGSTLTASPVGVSGGAASMSGGGSLGSSSAVEPAALLPGGGSLTSSVPLTFPGAATLAGSGTLLTGAETAPAVFPPPVVPVFPAGYQPVQADFTRWWYSVLGFFQNKPVFRAVQAASTTPIPTGGVLTQIGYDTVLEDPYQGWNTVQPGAWSPPAGYSGWYQVTVTLYTQDLPSGADIRALVGGTYTQDLGTTPGPTGHFAGVEGQFVIYLIGGQDFVYGAAELFASSSVSTADAAGQMSSMEVLWLSD
jgi:hypothetical protein